MSENGDSDTCQRQEDGTAEPIRKYQEGGGKRRKTMEKAIERRKTNIREKKLSNLLEFFYPCGGKN